MLERFKAIAACGQIQRKKYVIWIYDIFCETFLQVKHEGIY